MHTSDFADIAKTKLRQKQTASASPTTSTVQAIDSAPNTRKPKEVSDEVCKFPGPENAAYPFILDSNGRKHGRGPGQNIDFISSQANVWADEELVKQEPTMGDTWNLDNSKNINEEKVIRAGREHGAKTCLVFDEAWVNARDKS